MKLNVLTRWAGSFAMGCAIVYVLLVAGLYFAGRFEDEPVSRTRAQPVDLLAEVERVRLKDDLGLGARRSSPPPPPMDLPRRVSGFVQLEVEVGGRGDVLDARVLGAVPQGYYEKQALEEVRTKKYEPSPIGRYRVTEVVPFTVSVEAQDSPPDG